VLAVDHVMMGVASFEASAARWKTDHDLTAIPGIRFDDAPAFENWIVPLGGTWIELVGVADNDAARADPRAQMFSAMVSARDVLLGWALVPDDLDAVASRLGLPVSHQHATDPATGREFTWQQLGFDETRMEFYLPFFLRWEHEMHAEVEESTVELGNARAVQQDVSLALSGDQARLEQWLGEIEAPVTISDGPPGITAQIPTDQGLLTVG